MFLITPFTLKVEFVVFLASRCSAVVCILAVPHAQILPPHTTSSAASSVYVPPPDLFYLLPPHLFRPLHPKAFPPPRCAPLSLSLVLLFLFRFVSVCSRPLMSAAVAVAAAGVAESDWKRAGS